MNELKFGTAGIPFSTKKRNTLNGIKQVSNLGLNAMELEFVHSVNISKEKAPEVKKISKENNVFLSCHGSYYINLNSSEKSKVEASKKRILDAARILDLCGGKWLTFHAGYYMKENKDKVYLKIKNSLKEIIKDMKNENLNIMLRPELTGKETQFGDLNELLKLSQEIEIMPCYDFSHLHARYNGKYNTKEEFNEVFKKIEKFLGKEGLKNMHVHLSGINYGEKGEKNHLMLKDSDMNYKDLLKTFKEFNIKGAVICESPIIDDDALVLQKFYKKL